MTKIYLIQYIFNPLQFASCFPFTVDIEAVIGFVIFTGLAENRGMESSNL